MAQRLQSSALLRAMLAWCDRRANDAPFIVMALLIALAGELLMRSTPLPDGTTWLNLTTG